MREIKFRAWDKQDRRMIVDEQNFIPAKVTNKGVLRLNPHHEEELWNIVDKDRCELMQYTGLKDKNGKEIYEGDIISFLSGGNRYISEVWYGEDCGCYLVDEQTTILLDHTKRHADVMGNIYENLELIK